jgi:hypothetical protein
MADLLVEVPSPLRDCFLHCETECVRECCGINAITTELETVAAWRSKAGPLAAAQARRQLAELVDVVQDHTHNVSSLFLNHYTVNEAARQQLLTFLAAFQTGLALDTESFILPPTQVKSKQKKRFPELKPWRFPKTWKTGSG